MNKKENNVNVVLICDDGYVMPTAVALTSIVKNAKADRMYNLYVLCDKVSIEKQELLLSISSQNCLVKIVEVDSDKYKGFEKKYSKVTKSSLLKFSIPEYLPEIEKALYIDGDIIANKDISSLFDKSIVDVYAAVISDGPKDLKHLAGGKQHLYYANPKYFNSGVMLLNLTKMREDDISAKLIDFRINEYNYFMDQDAFNRVFGSKVVHVGLEYDFLLHLISFRNQDYSIKQLVDFYSLKPYSDIDDLLDDVVIFHYTFEKPWKYFDIPMNEIWMKYYKQSPYRNVNLNRKSYLTVLYNSKLYKIARNVKSYLHI